MPRFYRYGLYETFALIRMAEPGDPDDVDPFAYLDGRTGRWVRDPEIGSRVIGGEADPITLEESVVAAREILHGPRWTGRTAG